MPCDSFWFSRVIIMLIVQRKSRVLFAILSTAAVLLDPIPSIPGAMILMKTIPTAVLAEVSQCMISIYSLTALFEKWIEIGDHLSKAMGEQLYSSIERMTLPNLFFMLVKKNLDDQSKACCRYSCSIHICC